MFFMRHELYCYIWMSLVRVNIQYFTSLSNKCNTTAKTARPPVKYPAALISQIAGESHLYMSNGCLCLFGSFDLRCLVDDEKRWVELYALLTLIRAAGYGFRTEKEWVNATELMMHTNNQAG